MGGYGSKLLIALTTAGKYRSVVLYDKDSLNSIGRAISCLSTLSPGGWCPTARLPFFNVVLRCHEAGLFIIAA